MFDQNVGPRYWVRGPRKVRNTNKTPASHTVRVPVKNSSARDPCKGKVVGGGKNVKVNSGVDKNECLVEVFPELTHWSEHIGGIRDRVDNDDPMFEYF